MSAKTVHRCRWRIRACRLDDAVLSEFGVWQCFRAARIGTEQPRWPHADFSRGEEAVAPANFLVPRGLALPGIIATPSAGSLSPRLRRLIWSLLPTSWESLGRSDKNLEHFPNSAGSSPTLLRAGRAKFVNVERRLDFALRLLDTVTRSVRVRFCFFSCPGDW